MTVRVYTQQERSLDFLDHVAVAITLLREREGQQHVGILHRDETTSEVRMLHLAWHHVLRNSRPKESYAWVLPPIPKRRARQVAAFCRRIHRANPSGIPYAFSQASDSLDPQTGTFMLGPDRNGLTCATFVLGVFDSVGLPLIKYQTWPKSRSGDDEWQRSIVNQLREDQASPEHIERVTSEIGLVRYRPEDVAGAAAARKIPAGFASAKALALIILSKLHKANLFT